MLSEIEISPLETVAFSLLETSAESPANSASAIVPVHVRDLLALGIMDGHGSILKHIDLVFPDCSYPVFGILLRVN